MQKSEYQVLLFYKYVTITDPKKIRDEQKQLCTTLHLTGRIIIAAEGINGTVEGTKEDTQKYISAMDKSEYFKDIVYKKSNGTGTAFSRLSVKARPEIVTAGIPTLNPLKTTGKYITAQQLHTWFEEKKEFYIVDMRNNYEFEGGHFNNSIFSGMKHFFQLKEVLPKVAHLKNKTIVTVCTGGIRCEKASGFLVENGFADVYQLKDGIYSYMESYPNEHFKGKLYVFDSRMLIGFNTTDSTHEVIGMCWKCEATSERYDNCAYDICHEHYIVCENCLDKETKLAFCNEDCKKKYFVSRIPISL